MGNVIGYRRVILGGPWTLNGAREILDNSGWYDADKVVKAIEKVGKSPKRNKEDIERVQSQCLNRQGGDGIAAAKEVYLANEENRYLKGLSSRTRDDRKVAAEAIGILSETPGSCQRLTEAVELLIERLEKDESREVQIATVEALGKLKDERAFEPLIQILDGESMDLRMAALKALGRLTSKRGNEKVIELLESPERNIRKKAKEVFLYEMAGSKIQKLRRFTKVLENNNIGLNQEEIRKEAAETVKELQNSIDRELAKNIESLKGELKGENIATVRLAALALGESGDERAIDPLLRRLESDNESNFDGIKSVSVEVVNALGKLAVGTSKSEKVINGLTRRLERESETTWIGSEYVTSVPNAVYVAIEEALENLRAN